MTTLRQQITLVATLLLLSPIVAHAQTLTVAWDPNPPADQVTNYEVCIGTASLSCNFREASVPASQTTYVFTPNAGVLYYVAVRAVSAAGAGGYAPEVRVSTPSLSQPSNQTSTVNAAISPLSLSATDPDGDTLRFSHTGLPFGLSLNTTTGVITGTPTNTGTFNVSVFVADDLVTTSRSFVWTVSTGGSSDTTQPAVSITSHTAGQSVTSSSITLAGTATDSGTGNSGITGVTVNGVAATGGTATGSGTANWSRSVALATGANTLTVVATDGAGNTTSRQIAITRTSTASDTTAPTVSITSHTSGQSVTASSITLAGTATDSGTGNSGITAVSVNGSAASGGTATGSGTANWSRTVALSLGANTVTVVAADGASNNRTVQIVVTRVSTDTTAPTVAITSHTSGQTVTSSSITLSGTATDSGAGGSGVTGVTVNGQSASGGTASGNGTANWSRNLTLSAGANTLTVVATDGAGNARTVPLTLVYAPPVVPMTGASLSQNIASPQPTGTSVVFTATGSGGTAPYEYQWYLQLNGGTWAMLRAWSTATSYTWTPTQAGTYVMAIWARSSGSTANAWQAYTERTFIVVDGQQPQTPPPPPPSGPSVPMTSASLSTSLNSPQNTGATVTFTASGTGGTAPYEYQWYLQQNGGAWTMVRPWSTTTSYVWTPSQPGNYVMALWARSAGSTANAWQAYSERAFVINAPAGPTQPPPSPPPSGPSVPMTAAWLNSSAGSPQNTGTTVTFTAGGAGGTAPYEYQWYVQRDGGSWTMARSWSTTTSYAWTPSQAGNYMVAIWARSAGSTANAWQAYAERPFTINASAGGGTPPSTPSVPMTSASLTSNVASPQLTNATVTFSASGSGGTAPYEYQWYVQLDGGAWTLLRSWSTATTYAWTPTQAGSYVVALWGRSAGSGSTTWQAYAERPFVINTPTAPTPPAPPVVTTPMTAAWVSATLVSPQRQGTTVTFVAGGSGGVAPYEYQWYVQRDGGAWQLVRAWSTTTSYVLSNPQPGSYVVAVWARSAGTNVNAWQAYGERPFVIQP
jgi:hypothetical protein